MVALMSPVAAASPTLAQGTQQTINMGDNFFDPISATVAPGTTVTWMNNGTVEHTVNADNGSFVSPLMEPGDTFSQTLNAPGVYTYFCDIHSEMSATLTVAAAGGQTAPTAVALPAQAAPQPTVAPTPASASAPSSVAVTMQGFAFLPSNVTVTAGGSVTWTNNDRTTHTAT